MALSLTQKVTFLLESISHFKAQLVDLLSKGNRLWVVTSQINTIACIDGM